MNPTPLRVLVVDDSAFVRKVVREMLASSPAIQVIGVARDGEEALDMTAQLQPDLITCDLTMPRLDGVGFVRRQMARRPLPILVLTAAPHDTELVVEALNAGAIDFVQKPTALATDDLRMIRDQLVEKVQTAARAPVDHLLAPASAIAIPLTTSNVVRDSASRAQVVVLGISTGGPQALRQMLPLLPADFPVPFGIVLHMPVGYTALYAEKLNEICQIEVREAREGDVLRPGLVLIAQAGRHLQFRREANGSVTAQLTLQPLEKTHRPSVDVLFRSAAEAYGGHVLAVVMTGMGEDGKEGAAWVKAQGGTVLTEHEKSCIIYGMPRSVVEAGLSDAPIPLSEMAQAITARI